MDATVEATHRQTEEEVERLCGGSLEEYSEDGGLDCHFCDPSWAILVRGCRICDPLNYN